MEFRKIASKLQTLVGRRRVPASIGAGFHHTLVMFLDHGRHVLGRRVAA